MTQFRQAIEESTENLISPKSLQITILAIVTLICVYLCYLMATPFMSVLVWGLTLAVLFAPMQKWLESKLKFSNLAAAISVLIVAVIVIFPTIFLGELLLEEVLNNSVFIERKVNSGEWFHSIKAQPQIATILKKIERYISLPETVKTLNAKLGENVAGFIKGSAHKLIGILLVFYVLFFFLRDRYLLANSILPLLPLTHKEIDKLSNRVTDTIHAVVFGTFTIAAMQGILGGIMFWWLDLPTPLLWGLVMSLLAIIPMLGAAVVWVPTSLFLILAGNLVDAIILATWGMLVVSTIDNLLRPILLGKRLKLHTVLIFFSVTGGLLLFGSAGIILGPIILVVTITLFEIWFDRTSI